jgi:hypothetical protein
MALLVLSSLLPGAGGAGGANTPHTAAVAEPSARAQQPQTATAAAAAARFVHAPASLTLFASGGALVASRTHGRQLERGLKV